MLHSMIYIFNVLDCGGEERMARPASGEVGLRHDSPIPPTSKSLDATHNNEHLKPAAYCFPFFFSCFSHLFHAPITNPQTEPNLEVSPSQKIGAFSFQHSTS